jgi:hypothetical protein
MVLSRGAPGCPNTRSLSPGLRRRVIRTWRCWPSERCCWPSERLRPFGLRYRHCWHQRHCWHHRHRSRHCCSGPRNRILCRARGRPRRRCRGRRDQVPRPLPVRREPSAPSYVFGHSSAEYQPGSTDRHRRRRCGVLADSQAPMVEHVGLGGLTNDWSLGSPLSSGNEENATTHPSHAAPAAMSPSPRCAARRRSPHNRAST